MKIKRAIEYADFLRKKIERDFPGKVIFAIAEGAHKRKGWEKLSASIKTNTRQR